MLRRWNEPWTTLHAKIFSSLYERSRACTGIGQFALVFVIAFLFFCLDDGID